MRVRRIDLERAYALLSRHASRVTWSQSDGGLWVGAGSELECVVVSLGAALVDVAHLSPLVTTDQGVVEEEEFQVEVSQEGALLAGTEEVRFLSSSSPRLLRGPAGFRIGQGEVLGAELVSAFAAGLHEVTDAPVMWYRWDGWEELVGRNVAIRRKA